MKTRDLINAPLSTVMSMSKADLKKAITQMSMESNKRLAAFKRAGLSSPATVYMKKHGGKISAKKYKSLEGLREEYQRAAGFLKTETGTVSGYRAWQQKITNTLLERTGVDMSKLSESQKRRFWLAYSKLEELDAANVYGARYRTSVNEIYTAVRKGLRKKDIDSFVARMNTKIYEESSKNLFTDENDPFNLVDESENPFE